MFLSTLRRCTAIGVLLLSPLAVHAAPLTFNFGALLFDPDPRVEENAGRFSGSFDYDPDTSVFLVSRISLTLKSGLILDLGVIRADPDVRSLVVTLTPVDGETTKGGHDPWAKFTFDALPSPLTQSVDFNGRYENRINSSGPVIYGLRGTSNLTVPEPASLALVGLALVGLSASRRRKA